MSGFGEMLGALRRRDGLSQKELARRAGVSRSAIGMYEAGEREPSFETLQTFAGIFGVTADVLLGRPEAGQALPDNALPLLPVKKVPLLGTIACGTPVLAQENIAGYVDLPDHVGADFALVCQGTSMINAGIRDGDLLFVRACSQVQSGEIAVVLISDEEATVKKVILKDDLMVLEAANPEVENRYFTRDEVRALPVRIIAKAVFSKTYF